MRMFIFSLKITGDSGIIDEFFDKHGKYTFSRTIYCPVQTSHLPPEIVDKHLIHYSDYRMRFFYTRACV